MVKRFIEELGVEIPPRITREEILGKVCAGEGGIIRGFYEP